MSDTNNQFNPKSLSSRLKSMLKLDFYRLFHSPIFYIMLAIAAIIPAMVLGMSGAETTLPDGTVQTGIEFINTWQLVESISGAGQTSALDFSGYANINMLFIFAGLLMAIFVSHDYSSGFVKNIFTVHSKKMDYVVSKTAIGVFSGIGMIMTYVLGTVVAGLLTGKSFDVNVGGLILCLLSKAGLMGIFCALFLAVAVFFRSKLWMTIVFTFMVGMILYPAASIASLDSSLGILLLTITAGVVGAIGLGSISTLILNKRDLT